MRGKYERDWRYLRTAYWYEDSDGKLISPDELDELSAWEIEDRGIHVAEA